MLSSVFGAISAMATQSASSAYYYSYHYSHTKRIIDAIHNNDFDLFKILIETCQDFEAKGFARSILHEAIEYNRTEFVAHLMKRFLDVNEICEGKTALWRALEKENEDIIELLLQHNRSKFQHGFIHDLPSVLQAAVQNRAISLEAAQKLAYDIVSGYKKIDAIKPYLTEIETLFSTERKFQQEETENYNKLITAFDKLKYKDIYTDYIPYSIEDSAQVKSPTLVINYRSKYNLPELRNALNACAPYSHDWHYYDSVIRHQSKLAKQEQKQMQEFANECLRTMNFPGTQVSLKPYYDQHIGTSVVLQIPPLENKDLIQIKAIQAKYHPAFIQALREENLENLRQCFKEEYYEGVEPVFFLACQHGTMKTINRFIAAGADVNHRVKNISPLQIAYDRQDEALATLLIEKGADPNEIVEGKSPLHFAVMNNWPLFTKALLNKRANANIRFEDQTPLDSAIDLGRIEVLRVLRQHEGHLQHRHSYSYSKRNSYRTVFDWHSAIESNDFALMDCLIAMHVDCNVVHPQKGTPLHVAIQKADVALIDKLLQAGANAATKFKQLSAFEYAYELASTFSANQQKYLQIFEHLILNNIHKRVGASQAHLVNFCLQKGLNQATAFLLEQGINETSWNAHNRWLLPPLLTAIQIGSVRKVQDLIRHDQLGKTTRWCLQHKVKPPLNQAVKTLDPDILDAILLYYNESQPLPVDIPLLHEAIRNHTYQSIVPMLRRLVRFCDVNELDRGLTPLQVAINQRDDIVTDYLIDHCPTLNINAPSSSGNTALHLALARGVSAFSLISKLIDNNSSLLQPNQDGICCIDLIMFSKELREKFVEVNGDAFLNKYLSERTLLAICLDNATFKARISSDSLLGEPAMNWFKEQATKGPEAAYACILRLCEYHEDFVAFIKENLGENFYQFLQQNKVQFLNKFTELQTPPQPEPQPEPIPEPLPEPLFEALPERAAQEPILNHYQQYYAELIRRFNEESRVAQKRTYDSSTDTDEFGDYLDVLRCSG